MVFSKYRPSSFIEALGSPEKGGLYCVDLLAGHLFDIGAIFAMTASRQQRKEELVRRM